MKRKPRVIAPANEAHATMRYCTCCGRKLNRNIAWLELDQRTDSYHDFGGVPSEKSQGWFPFGIACATKRINAA